MIPGVEMGTSEIGDAIGISRQGVEQILSRALAKLKVRAERRGLR